VNRRDLVGRVLLAATAAVVVGVRAPAPVHSDFCSYYAAGRLTLEGRAAAAYDAAELERTHRAVHDIGRRAGPFLYSPLTLLPAAALATAPLPEAAAVNRWLGAAALGGGLLLVLLALDGVAAAAATALVFVLAHATQVQLVYENWTFALFALTAGAALAARRGRPALAGALAACAVHLKAFVVFAVVPLAAGRRRRVLAWTALVGALLVVVSIAATGVEPWRLFAGQLAGGAEHGVTPFYNKCSLAANLARLASEPREWVAARAPVESWPVRAVFWFGVPLLVWGSWRLRRAPEPALAFGLAWTLLFVPQIWEHTELLLFAVLPALASRWRAIVLGGLALTLFYGGLQQELLRAVLSGTRPAAALEALLLLYPFLNLLVLGAALASGDAQGARAEAEGARAT
jgi:hypothetical protein